MLRGYKKWDPFIPSLRCIQGPEKTENVIQQNSAFSYLGHFFFADDFRLIDSGHQVNGVFTRLSLLVLFLGSTVSPPGSALHAAVVRPTLACLYVNAVYLLLTCRTREDAVPASVGQQLPAWRPAPLLLPGSCDLSLTVCN